MATRSLLVFNPSTKRWEPLGDTDAVTAGRATFDMGGLTAARSISIQDVSGTLALANYSGPINAQTGTSYTLALSDAGLTVTLSNASPVALTVPENSSVAFPVGSVIYGRQTGAGQVTIAGAGGVTVNAGGGGLKTLRQWSVFTLEKTATDTWLAYGELTA